MALMTDEIQAKLVTLLQEEGLVSAATIEAASAEGTKAGKTLLQTLTSTRVIDDELLTHAIAQVSGVPYVNLTRRIIDQSILSLLPSDIAERFMAVPLAEATGHIHLVQLTPAFAFHLFEDGLHTFFLGFVDKATGIHYHDIVVGSFVFMHHGNIIGTQLSAEHLAVHHVLAATKGDDIDFVFA